MQIKGIDVSKHQGRIDWDQVKNSGQVEFAIIRSSYGWENYPNQVDSEFVNNVRGCIAREIPFGIYHYSYATNVDEARQEADYCLRALEGYQPTYPVFFDVEDRIQTDLGQSMVTQMALAFCRKIEAAGHLAGVYTYKNFFLQNIDYDQVKEYEIWIAQFANENTFPYHYDMWQYSSNGTIPGINGRVDLDYSYKDYTSLTPDEPTPTPTPTPSNETKTTANVNFRTAAQTEARIIAVIPQGTTVKWLADDKWGWSKIEYRGTTGWVSNLYLSKQDLSSYPTGTCLGTDVNMRTGPGVFHRRITRLQPGNTFTIVCILPNRWMQVIFNGTTGYIKFDPSYIRYRLNP